MVIWLRNAPVAPGSADGAPLRDVGLEDGDVLRREDYATAVGIDEAYDEASRQCGEALEQARREAEAIVTQARETAAALRAAAQEEYEGAAARGYEDGEQRAVADWQQRCAQLAADQRTLQLKMRRRLAELVMAAVEQIVGAGDPAALFAQAVPAVERIIEGSSGLTVRVHPAEHAAASREFGRCAAEWLERGRPVRLAVVADKSVARGTCLCESDLGTLDASLATQLAAMRVAVDRAMGRMDEVWMTGGDGQAGDGGESDGFEPRDASPDAFDGDADEAAAGLDGYDDEAGDEADEGGEYAFAGHEERERLDGEPDEDGAAESGASAGFAGRCDGEIGEPDEPGEAGPDDGRRTAPGAAGLADAAAPMANDLFPQELHEARS
ncbi:type III secretion system stator protein SctL [Burkholderia sp. WAC0059]|uniref:type III secretion system stator protein SctL n=1 Tax=Burkholderia sp. WAC0059 TaxID=2066022 RepID=UPI0015E08044|nr:type III secretion system stator protein SctL [Burkholderia sp. WAC0059]